jgi:hypothetical protein
MSEQEANQIIKIIETWYLENYVAHRYLKMEGKVADPDRLLSEGVAKISSDNPVRARFSGLRQVLYQALVAPQPEEVPAILETAIKDLLKKSHNLE